MKIQLISHASVIIESKDCKILTDPWLKGTAFNDSWALSPPAAIDSLNYSEIDYLWISHEHPDHFHIPTLVTMPDEFKQSVTILYQENNSNKMINALKKFGFSKFIILPNRKVTKITEETSVYCFQVGSMDSSLGVIDDTDTVYSVNDCELSSKDCSIVKKDIGTPSVVLNQFSIAGYSGHKDRDAKLKKMAQSILNNCSDNHRDLGAKITIPFASFVYFCQEDNAYINEYHNSPLDFCKHMDNEKLDYALLYPGDSYSLDAKFDNASAKEKYTKLEHEAEQTIVGTITKPLEEIQAVFLARFEQIERDYSFIFRRLLKPVTVEIKDINKKIRFCFKDGAFAEIETDESCDLEINSQPIWFGFKFPFGIQTLGVSARYTLNQNEKNWKRHRILFSLNNAEIYLSWKIFSWSNLNWLKNRFYGVFSQLTYQLNRM